MSNNRIRILYAWWQLGWLGLAASLACAPMPAGAYAGHSSPEERQRFVAITRALEQAPLKAGAKADRAWAIAWLTDAPDVSVNICPDTLGGLLESNYAYAGEIVLQDTFAMGAFAIEHPDAASHGNAQQMAGVEGAIAAYRSILRDKPEAKSSDLEKLIQMQARGELPEFVRKASIRCSAEKGEKTSTP